MKPDIQSLTNSEMPHTKINLELEATFAALEYPNADDTLALAEYGIVDRAIHRTWDGQYDPLKAANILPLHGNRFEFCSDGTDGARRAVIARGYDTTGLLIDLISVDLASKWTGLYLGHLAVAGEDNLLGEPCLGEGIQTHRNGASWIASGRRGILIFNPVRARPSIMELTGPRRQLTVQDHEMASRLRDKLVWEPSIRVDPSEFFPGRVSA
jgi:hypothetical protein